MDFSTIKSYLDISKDLANYFLPFRISLSTNYLLSRLNNILLRSFYSPSILEKMSSLPSKNFFKTRKAKKDQEMKPSRRTSRRMTLEEDQEQASRRTSPSYSSKSYILLFSTFHLDISKSLVINS